MCEVDIIFELFQRVGITNSGYWLNGALTIDASTNVCYTGPWNTSLIKILQPLKYKSA